MNAKPSRVQIPESASKFKVNLFAIFLSLLNLLFFKFRGSTDVEFVTQTTIFTYAAIIAFHDIFFLKSYKFSSMGLSFTKPKPRRLDRIIFRLFGLLGSVGFIGLLYAIFKEYHGDFYTRYWNLLRLLAPVFVVMAPIYFYWIDAFQKESADTYLKIGNLFLFRTKDLSKEFIIKHFLGWIIKGFFFPLMYIYANHNVSYLLNASLHFDTFMQFYDFMWNLIFGVDVLVVSMSYVLTLQLLDTHVRSPQPSALGWVFALMCYQPFWSTIGSQYLSYDDNLVWDQWLSGNDTLRIIWGATILILITIYSLSSTAFGLRFSNLTNRGIITGGPYRWTKHPAYISKNLAWWLIAIPFVSLESPWEAARNCIILALLNLVYFIRAKTEESHLMEEPAYQEYSRYISRHGLFAKILALRGKT